MAASCTCGGHEESFTAACTLIPSPYFHSDFRRSLNGKRDWVRGYAAWSAPLLHEGAPLLPEGAPLLHEGAPLLHEGAPLLHEGAPLLHEGAPLLHEGAPLLHEGAPLLHEGAPLLHEGAPLLYEGAYHRSPYVTTRPLPLQVEGVPLAHVSSLAAAHKQVVALSFTHSDLTGVQEVLVDKAAEARPAPVVTMETKDQVENWRIVATTKFPDKRLAFDVHVPPVLQSWWGEWPVCAPVMVG